MSRFAGGAEGIVMMTLDEFLQASPQRRLLSVKKGDVDEAALRDYFGDAFDDYYSVAAKTDVEHAAGGSDVPTNLIFVPGVMGSFLYPKGMSGVWWIDLRTRAHIDDLRLAPDGLGDANRKYKVDAFTIDPTYDPFVSSLVSRDDFFHLSFSYDWRKSFYVAAAGLFDLIEKTYAENGGTRLHLVAHSMGGLVIRTMLARHGSAALWRKLGRIVFVGTPHFGSPAVAGYLANHLWGWEMLALLGKYLSRETFRSFWGVLGLLPAPPGIYPDSGTGHPCANFDMYDADQWALDLSSEKRDALSAVLRHVRETHEERDRAYRALDEEYLDRMLMIAGVGYRCLFRLERQKGLLKPRFEKITSRKPGDPHRDGDGRVPLASAVLARMRNIRYAVGVHGSLMNYPFIQYEIFRFLKEQPMGLPTSPESALAEHLADEGTTSRAPRLDLSARAVNDDPGYLDEEDVSPETLEELDARLEGGDLRAFNLTRIF